MKVKICGQTTVEGCRLSVRYGADYLGVVLEVPESPRSLTVEQAAPIFELFADRTFLLTRDAPPERIAELAALLHPAALQPTGAESPDDVRKIAALTGLPVYKSLHLAPAGQIQPGAGELVARIGTYADAGASGVVLDTAARGLSGGTGMVSDWGLAAAVAERSPLPLFLAGGIGPENVAAAVAVPGVAALDLASGVEGGVKGIKSEERLRFFFDRYRAALAGE